MSGRDWLRVAALGGCLALTAAGPPSHQQQQAKPATKATELPSASSDYAPYPDKNSESCYNAKNHEAADLCAQWRAAFAAEKAASLAWWTNLFAVVSLAVGALGFAALIYTLRQTERALGQAKRANDIAEGIGQAQVRAYLAGQGGSYQRSKGLITGVVVVKNFGQSPARNVRVEFICRFVPRPAPCMPASGPLHEEKIRRGPVTIQAVAVHKFFFHWQWQHFDGGLGLEDKPDKTLFDWIVTADLSWRDVFKKEETINFTLSPSPGDRLFKHPGLKVGETGKLYIRPT